MSEACVFSCPRLGPFRSRVCVSDSLQKLARCSTLKRSSIIVDDDVSARESLTELFTDFGLSVRSAEDGSSALFEIRQEVPDIILSDLNMPRMSGCEFLSLVRRRFPAIRVIAMSGAFSRRRYTARDCRGRFL